MKTGDLVKIVLRSETDPSVTAIGIFMGMGNRGARNDNRFWTVFWRGRIRTFHPGSWKCEVLR